MCCYASTRKGYKKGPFFTVAMEPDGQMRHILAVFPPRVTAPCFRPSESLCLCRVLGTQTRCHSVTFWPKAIGAVAQKMVKRGPVYLFNIFLFRPKIFILKNYFRCKAIWRQSALATLFWPCTQHGYFHVRGVDHTKLVTVVVTLKGQCHGNSMWFLDHLGRHYIWVTEHIFFRHKQR